MRLTLHANATTTPRTRAYIQQSHASNAALDASSGSITAPWRGGKAARTSPIVPPARIAWPPP
jgi:hypothetical protein